MGTLNNLTNNLSSVKENSICRRGIDRIAANIDTVEEYNKNINSFRQQNENFKSRQFEKILENYMSKMGKSSIQQDLKEEGLSYSCNDKIKMQHVYTTTATKNPIITSAIQLLNQNIKKDINSYGNKHFQPHIIHSNTLLTELPKNADEIIECMNKLNEKVNIKQERLDNRIERLKKIGKNKIINKYINKKS